MKAIIIGLAAMCLGTVGLASSASRECEEPERSSAGSARSSPLGFAAIGRVGSPV